MTTPLLKVSGLTKHFPTAKTGLFTDGPVVQAVDNISFELASGEALGLVGESGCGKSTTGRLITRLIEPTAGSIQFEGQDISNLSAGDLRPIRTHMQMIFQDPYASLNPRQTVGKIIGTSFGKNCFFKCNKFDLLPIISTFFNDNKLFQSFRKLNNSRVSSIEIVLKIFSNSNMCSVLSSYKEL